ncbi:hypothetical protein AAC387_Pa06g1355 [Persea americana]
MHASLLENRLLVQGKAGGRLWRSQKGHLRPPQAVAKSLIKLPHTRNPFHFLYSPFSPPALCPHFLFPLPLSAFPRSALSRRTSHPSAGVSLRWRRHRFPLSPSLSLSISLSLSAGLSASLNAADRGLLLPYRRCCSLSLTTSTKVR